MIEGSALDFLHEYCRFSPGSVTLRDEVYAQYTLYCQQKGIIPLARHVFGRVIREFSWHIKLGERRINQKRIMVYRNLQIISKLPVAGVGVL